MLLLRSQLIELFLLENLELKHPRSHEDESEKSTQAMMNIRSLSQLIDFFFIESQPPGPV